MDSTHKSMKVNSFFCLDRQSIEKHIAQQCLATSHPTPQVQASLKQWRRGKFFLEKRRQKTSLLLPLQLRPLFLSAQQTFIQIL